MFGSTEKTRADVRSIDQLAALFDLPEWDAVEEMNEEAIFRAGDQAQREAEEEGGDDMDAYTAGQDAERTEIYNKWYDAVEGVAETFFNYHGLEFKGSGASRRPYQFKIIPINSWDAAANKIRTTINGVGDFHFASLREFLNSGPYTARQAVLKHLAYIPDYARVYGGTSPQRMYEQLWR